MREDGRSLYEMARFSSHAQAGPCSLRVRLLLVGSASGPLGYAAGLAPHPGVALLVSWLVTFWLVWLVWLVWRGGRISHWILVMLGSGLGCVNAAFHIPKHPAALILLIIYASQLTLLLSPALDRHTNPQAAADMYDAYPRLNS
jgi:hypothetical protein